MQKANDEEIEAVHLQAGIAVVGVGAGGAIFDSRHCLGLTSLVNDGSNPPESWRSAAARPLPTSCVRARYRALFSPTSTASRTLRILTAYFGLPICLSWHLSDQPQLLRRPTGARPHSPALDRAVPETPRACATRRARSELTDLTRERANFSFCEAAFAWAIVHSVATFQFTLHRSQHRTADRAQQDTLQ